MSVARAPPDAAQGLRQRARRLPQPAPSWCWSASTSRQKAAWVARQVEAALDADRRRPPVEWSLARTDRADADTEEAASCRLRVTRPRPRRRRVGQAFTAPLVELALASYPGFTLTAPPAPATPYGVYRPAYVDRSAVARAGRSLAGGPHPSTIADEADRPPVRRPVTLTQLDSRPVGAGIRRVALLDHRRGPLPPTAVPLGHVAHARSGDKGGDANIGLWARDAPPARTGSSLAARH